MRPCVHCLVLILLSSLLSAHAQDITFHLGETHIEGVFSTTIAAGTGIRTNHASAALTGAGFGANGKPKGGISEGAEVTDSGDLNFGAGDLFSTPIRAFSRLRLKDGIYSIVVSARLWSDFTLVNHAVPQGNIPNGAVSNKTLSSSGLTSLNKFTNIVPWEAYATLSPSDHWSLSVGRQNLNWSVARYFPGASHISATDFNASWTPGALADREVDIPTGAIDVQYKLPAGWEIEGFYQLEQRPENLPPCGTLFSANNIGVDPSCGGVPASAFTGVNALFLPAAAAVWDNSAYNLANGNYIPRGEDRTYGEHTQGGLRLRRHFTSLDFDAAIYALNLEARADVLSTTTPVDYSFTPVPNLVQAGAPPAFAGVIGTLKSGTYFYEFPGNIQTYGATASKTWHGVTAATELEYSPNQAVGYNTADQLVGWLHQGPLAPKDAALGLGTYSPGYQRLHVWHADLNLARKFSNVLKARQLVLYAEGADQAVTDLPSMSQARFGRGFPFGFATEGFGGLPACGAVTSPLSQPLSGCFNKGFVTGNAFGYVTRIALDYGKESSLTLSPFLTWTHNVKGTSPDAKIIDNRGVIAPGIEWKWRKRYFGRILYNAPVTDSTYWTRQDRRYVMLSSGVQL